MEDRFIGSTDDFDFEDEESVDKSADQKVIDLKIEMRKKSLKPRS